MVRLFLVTLRTIEPFAACVLTVRRTIQSLDRLGRADSDSMGILSTLEH